MNIVFKKIERNPDVWSASIQDAEHCCGCGSTPEEAAGWLLLNHPERLNIEYIGWIHRPPKMTPPSEYPSGKQG